MNSLGKFCLNAAPHQAPAVVRGVELLFDHSGGGDVKKAARVFEVWSESRTLQAAFLNKSVFI